MVFFYHTLFLEDLNFGITEIAVKSHSELILNRVFELLKFHPHWCGHIVKALPVYLLDVVSKDHPVTKEIIITHLVVVLCLAPPLLVGDGEVVIDHQPRQVLILKGSWLLNWSVINARVLLENAAYMAHKWSHVLVNFSIQLFYSVTISLKVHFIAKASNIRVNSLWGLQLQLN
jgi:hypothetical protein